MQASAVIDPHPTLSRSLSSEPATGLDLIASLLDDQRDLSAVERFAQLHEQAEAPLQGRFYRSLMPATQPGPGQQLAFEVDLDRCSGCKACVAACHVMNGLDDHESWRDVGLLVGDTGGLPVLQHVTSACHHCLEPACLTACPVDAYEKDPVTGIVRHLDDQCFGCQYCLWACPYDAPKYHAGKGIVRKCDMCSDRLGAGEAPACVQACPHEAIRIRVVDRDEVEARAAAGEFLPTAPEPAHTLPATRYLSSRALGEEMWAADCHRDTPEHVPFSLVLMLVLTQASVGTFAAELLMRLGGGQEGALASAVRILGSAFGLLGLSASLFHLGRPQFAFRALIGLRHSWLSREVAAFGAFAALVAGLDAMSMGWLGRGSGHPAFATALSAAVVAGGGVGVACSVMVYHATRRPFWRREAAAGKFAGTSLVLGAAAALGAASWWVSRGAGTLAAVALVAATALKLGLEARDIAAIDAPVLTPERRSARLLKGSLGSAWRRRRSLAFLGGIALPVLWLGTGAPMQPQVGQVIAALALVTSLAGELTERSLFFAAVVRPKMPGGIVS